MTALPLWAISLAIAIAPAGHPRTPPSFVLAQESAQGTAQETAHETADTLKQKVIDRFREVEARQQGVFNEEITDLIAPLFPPGTTLDETTKTIEQEKIGKLHRFKGTMEPGDGAMFVTDFNLMIASFSHVYVVIDLSFVENSEGRMVVRKSKAFLRSDNM